MGGLGLKGQIVEDQLKLVADKYLKAQLLKIHIQYWTVQRQVLRSQSLFQTEDISKKIHTTGPYIIQVLI